MQLRCFHRLDDATPGPAQALSDLNELDFGRGDQNNMSVPRATCAHKYQRRLIGFFICASSLGVIPQRSGSTNNSLE